MELFHPDPATLNRIAEEFVGALANVDGVFDIRSNRDDGFRELQLELKPPARTLGLTLDDLARQVRSAFFGSEALRVAFGVLVATPLLMLVVPALVMSQANFGTRLRARFSRTAPGSPSGRAA